MHLLRSGPHPQLLFLGHDLKVDAFLITWISNNKSHGIPVDHSSKWVFMLVTEPIIIVQVNRDSPIFEIFKPGELTWSHVSLYGIKTKPEEIGREITQQLDKGVEIVCKIFKGNLYTKFSGVVL